MIKRIEHLIFDLPLYSFAPQLSQMCIIIIIFVTGNACRHQVNSYLRQKYETLEETEEDLNINYFSGGLQGQSSEESTNPGDVTGTPQSLQRNRTPLRNTEECFGDSIAKVI